MDRPGHRNGALQSTSVSPKAAPVASRRMAPSTIVEDLIRTEAMRSKGVPGADLSDIYNLNRGEEERCKPVIILKTENPEPSRTITGPDKSVETIVLKDAPETRPATTSTLNACKPTKITPTTEEPPGFRKNHPHHLQRTIPCRSTHLPPFQILLDVQLGGSEKEKNHHGMEKNRTGLPTQTPRYWSETLPPVLTGTTSYRRRSSLRNRC
ncbi:uncharacterized protein LOC128093411 [Culex pipiens pallens]|uniref:uncharacterized protein LOC128093411 n=1 Tax=Culex pipiens pallens TaxID=42434 RepID=UPI0022AA5314|nr:uncharacterized protein LOC128093411 [Culex pipiens pallens]